MSPTPDYKRGRSQTEQDLLAAARAHMEKREGIPQAVTAPVAVLEAPVTSPPPAAPAEPLPAPVLEEAALFDPADLYAPLPGRSQWYTMPNGKRVCVHPTSADENLWIQRQVLKELRAEKRMPPENADAERRQEFLVEVQGRVNLWTTIVVCRAGEALDARKVFRAEDAQPLRRNPGWAEACGAIAQISAQLGSGESEAEALRRLLESFFGQLGSRLGTMCGPNGTGPNCSLLSRLGTSASSAKPLEQRLVELTHLLNQPE
jgi:hypothetical protein